MSALRDEHLGTRGMGRDLYLADVLFDALVNVSRVLDGGRVDNTVLHFHISGIGRASSSRSTASDKYGAIAVRITDPSDPFFLLSNTITEESFRELRGRHQYLFGFSEFPSEIAKALTECREAPAEWAAMPIAEPQGSSSRSASARIVDLLTTIGPSLRSDAFLAHHDIPLTPYVSTAQQAQQLWASTDAVISPPISVDPPPPQRAAGKPVVTIDLSRRPSPSASSSTFSSPRTRAGAASRWLDVDDDHSSSLPAVLRISIPNVLQMCDFFEAPMHRATWQHKAAHLAARVRVAEGALDSVVRHSEDVANECLRQLSDERAMALTEKGAAVLVAKLTAELADSASARGDWFARCAVAAGRETATAAQAERRCAADEKSLLRAELEEVKRALSEERQSLESTTAQLAAQTARAKKAEGEAVRLTLLAGAESQKVQAAETTAASVNEQVSRLEAEVAALQSTVATTQRSLEAAEQQVVQLTSVKSELQQQLSSSQTAHTSSREYVADLEAQLKTLRAQYATVSAEAAAATADVGVLRTRCHTAEDSLRKALADLDAAQGEAVREGAKAAALEKDRDARAGEVLSLRQELEGAQRSLAYYNVHGGGGSSFSPRGMLSPRMGEGTFDHSGGGVRRSGSSASLHGPHTMASGGSRTRFSSIRTDSHPPATHALDHNLDVSELADAARREISKRSPELVQSMEAYLERCQSARNGGRSPSPPRGTDLDKDVDAVIAGLKMFGGYGSGITTNSIAPSSSLEATEAPSPTAVEALMAAADSLHRAAAPSPEQFRSFATSPRGPSGPLSGSSRPALLRTSPAPA